MDANEYQKLAARTLADEPPRVIAKSEMMQLWNALGLVSEAGEVAELFKKGIFHDHGVYQEKLIKELGDVMWYIAGLCTTAGITLDEVMQTNIGKLRQRYPKGFRVEDSLARVDVEDRPE